MISGFVRSCYLDKNQLGDFLNKSLCTSPFTMEDMYSMGQMALHTPMSYETFHFLITWPFFEPVQRAEMFLPFLFSGDEYNDKNAWKRAQILISTNDDVMCALHLINSTMMDDDDRTYVIKSSATIFDEDGTELKPIAFRPNKNAKAFTSEKEAQAYDKLIRKLVKRMIPPGPYTSKKDASYYSNKIKEMSAIINKVDSGGRVFVEEYEVEGGQNLMEILQKWASEQGLTVQDPALEQDIIDLKEELNVAFDKIDEIRETTQKLTADNKELDADMERAFNDIDDLMKKQTKETAVPEVKIKKEENEPEGTGRVYLTDVFASLDGRESLRKLNQSNEDDQSNYVTPNMSPDIIELVDKIQGYPGVKESRDEIWDFVNKKFEAVENSYLTIKNELDAVRQVYQTEEALAKMRQQNQKTEPAKIKTEPVDPLLTEYDMNEDFSIYGNVTPNI